MPDSTALPWDAREYDAVAAIQERWGVRLMERSPWPPDAVVLDAGCGSGRLLPHLLARIPQGELVAVDRDAGMVQEAQQRYAALHSPVPASFAVAELGGPPLPAVCGAERFDLVFSNAVFHWIHDKLRLFGQLNRVLKPGGRLSAEFGGDKNLQRTRAAAYRAARNLGLGAAWTAAAAGYVFQSAADTRAQLKLCGFRQVRVTEHPQEEGFDDQDAYLRFCAAVIFRHLQAGLSPPAWEAFRSEFAAQAFALLGGWKLDYVRQTVTAEK